MRADLSTIQQTLTPEAASALARAMEEAGRRRHGQTTPLHVAAALLAAPTGLLRSACVRSHNGPTAGRHPLQCRALELCFSVALDRLPCAGGAYGPGPASAPPVSNALVAALKRAQAQQRRGCPEAAQQPLLAVKVELEQLVISILDDPSVSRVMREASFSSPAVKSTIEQSLSSSSAPSSCSSAASNLLAQSNLPQSLLSPQPSTMKSSYLNPRLAAAAAAAGAGVAGNNNPASAATDESKKVFDIMLRSKKRNPILVGDAGPEAVLKEALRKLVAGGAPAPLRGVQVIEFGALDKGDDMCLRICELASSIESGIRERGGVVLDFGDLKWLVEVPGSPGATAVSSEAGKMAVMEIGRLLKRFNGEDGGRRLWLVGTAACATYLRCQVYHTAMEGDWDLQAVPIARRAISTNVFPRLGGNNGILRNSVETPSPMRGLMAAAPTPFRWPPGSAEPPSGKTTICQLCTPGYERELTKLVSEQFEKAAAPRPESDKAMPHWLKLGTDQPSQPKEQELEWKKSTDELEKKWRDMCSKLHPPRLEKPATLSMPLAAFGPPRSLVEPNLAINRPTPTPRMNTNWERVVGYSSTELCKSHLSSPVKTDLVLGRSELSDTSVNKVQKDSFKDGLTDYQKAKIAGISDIESFKRLLKGLTEKVSWQHDAASAIAAVVVQCRTGDGKRRSSGPKGDTWLMFVGPDQVGKQKMATALSELMCNAGPVIINFGGNTGGANMGFRGKTSLDRVSEAVRQNPFSVIVLQGIDQADALVLRKIKQAMETGRIPDSHGREVSLGNVIFVLTSNWTPEELNASYETLLQFEEKMLESANSTWQLELSVHDNPAKHRADWLCDDGRPTKLPKEMSGGIGLSLDLNLSCGGAADDTEGSRNSSDLTVENEHDRRQLAVKCMTSSPASELLELVDDAIVFRPVDLAPMRKKVLECVLSKFKAIIGNRCLVQIDETAVDRMVGGLWVTGEEVEDWADKVLVPSIRQLRSNLKPEDSRSVVHLAAVCDKMAQRNGSPVEALPATVAIAVDVI